MLDRLLSLDGDTHTYEVEELLPSPRLYLMRGFVSDEECEHLISLVRESIQPSSTVDPDTGALKIVQERTSSSMHLWLGQTPMVSAVEQRIATLIGLPVIHGEGLQVLNYKVGQEYKPHFDFFDPNLKGSAVVMECGGQRVATCLMYLNTPEEGGETYFPEVDLKVAPRKGDAVLFFNTLPDGEVDRMSLHSSLPVTTGEKWVATKWVRARPYVLP